MPRADSAGGRVEVIAGPMFAGKTEELLRRVRRTAIASQRVVVISHAIEPRASRGDLHIPSGAASKTASE